MQRKACRMKQSKPIRFEARIGGIQGFSFSASLAGEQVEYTEFSEGLQPILTEKLVPSPSKWHALHKAMDDVALWHWESEYFNPNVIDGTSWEIECVWGDKSIQTAGSNAYPSDEDPAKTAYCPNIPDRFDKMLRAVSALLNGAPFE